MSRAYERILLRGTRFGRVSTRARRLPVYAFQCLFAFGAGLVLSGVLFTHGSHVPGAACLLTFGALFLLLVLSVDYSDVLVNRDEYLTLAHHPHDPWSVLLAKIVVYGRGILTLGISYFLPGTILFAVAYRSTTAGAAFLTGAILLAITVGAGGMLLGALLNVQGRSVLNRLLPLVQAVYMVALMSAMNVVNIVRAWNVPKLSDIGWLQWAIPFAWFVWPAEAVVGEATHAMIIRFALSLACLVIPFLIGSLWIAGHVGERMLEQESSGPRGHPRSSAWAPSWATSFGNKGRLHDRPRAPSRRYGLPVATNRGDRDPDRSADLADPLESWIGADPPRGHPAHGPLQFHDGGRVYDFDHVVQQTPWGSLVRLDQSHGPGAVLDGEPSSASSGRGPSFSRSHSRPTPRRQDAASDRRHLYDRALAILRRIVSSLAWVDS